MLGADVLAKCLELEGVEYVFGYPGVAICPFFEAITHTDVKTVLVRQEQSAGHIASGYARITGKVGVAAVTSGPGATNLITGIATAYADSIPLVCITGQVDSRLMGSDVFQEADVSGACESFVKYSYIVRNVNDIPHIVKEAFMIANTGRKGPVLIDIPIDVANTKVRDFQYPEEASMRSYKPTVKGNPVQIKKVIKELEKARRPILMVGGGAHLSRGAVAEIRKFVDKYNMPTVSTMMGLSILPTKHPCFLGMTGSNGNAYCNKAMNEADLIIVAGARVADRTVRQPSLALANKVLVHIDVDPAEIGKNAGPNIPIVGELQSIFEDLNAQEINTEWQEWYDHIHKVFEGWKAEVHQEYVESDRKRRAGEIPNVDPRVFINEMSKKMDANGVYVVDVGQNQMWSCRNFIVQEGGRFMTSGGFGTMGYALPAAIGAKLAAPDRQVVALCGDGGFQMTMQELATANQYGVPVKLIVLNNGTLGLVRQYQHFNYKDNYSMVHMPGSLDFEKLAEAYGMEFVPCYEEAEMFDAIDRFLGSEKSSIMEVKVNMEDLC